MKRPTNNELTSTAASVYAMSSLFYLAVLYLLIEGTSPNGFYQSILDIWDYVEAKEIIQLMIGMVAINSVMSFIILFSRHWSIAKLTALLIMSWALVFLIAYLDGYGVIIFYLVPAACLSYRMYSEFNNVSHA